MTLGNVSIRTAATLLGRATLRAMCSSAFHFTSYGFTAPPGGWNPMRA